MPAKNRTYNNKLSTYLNQRSARIFKALAYSKGQCDSALIRRTIVDNVINTIPRAKQEELLKAYNAGKYNKPSNRRKSKR